MSTTERLSDERLVEIASAAHHLTAHSPHPRITVAEAAALVTELQHSRAAEAVPTEIAKGCEGQLLNAVAHAIEAAYVRGVEWFEENPLDREYRFKAGGAGEAASTWRPVSIEIFSTPSVMLARFLPPSNLPQIRRSHDRPSPPLARHHDPLERTRRICRNDRHRGALVETWVESVRLA